MMNSRFIGGTAPRPGTNRCDSCGAPLPERAPRVDQMTFAEYQEHRERAGKDHEGALFPSS